MATRSRIAVELEEGKVISVYCHSDGYVSGVGEQLMKRFPNGTDPSVVADFIKEGDRSTLDMSYAEWRGEKCRMIDFHVNCCEDGYNLESDKLLTEDVKLDIKAHAEQYFNKTFKSE